MSARGITHLQNMRCPHCRSPLLVGPRGGAAVNLYCTNRDDCRQGYNVVMLHNIVVIAHEIGEVADPTYAMYARAYE